MMFTRVRTILRSALVIFSVTGTGLVVAASDSRAADPEGSVVVAWAGPMTSLDPHRVAIADQIYQFLMYDRITRVDAGFNIQPMLAKSWAFGDGGKTLTLKLRDDVTFHDGTPFNAAAVKANLERAKQIERSTVANLLASIQSIDVVGDYEVRLNLTEGEGGNLPAVLATSAGAMISPKAIADGRNLTLEPKDAGSGPYMPQTIRPNDTVIFVPAPNKYWDPAAGRLKQFELRYVAQGAARLNGVRSGQFDVGQMLGNDIEPAKKLSETGAFVAFVAQSANVQSLLLRADRAALKDPKLRQAVAHAVDREAVIKAAFAGNCLAADQPVLKGHWAYNPDLGGYSSYDPAKSEALVKESGIASPSFDIAFAPGTSWEPQANIIQGMLAKVGINAKLVPMQQADGLAAFRNGQVDSLQYTVPATIDPSAMVNQLYVSGSSVAPADRKDEVLNMAKLGTNPSLTPEKRADVYRKIFQTAAEGVWTFPICATNIVWAHKKNVTGIETADWHFAGLPDLRNLAVTK